MKYCNIIFYISALLFSTSSWVWAEISSIPKNSYAPAPPLESSNNIQANAQTFWEDKYRTANNPWLAARQAMLYASPLEGNHHNAWSNATLPSPPVTYYPNRTYNAYTQTPQQYTGIVASPNYYPQSYTATPNNHYPSAQSQQQQYAPRYYPQYQYTQQYVQQPNQPNSYSIGMTQPNYNVPHYTNPPQAHIVYPNQAASAFVPNNQYNAPSNHAAPPSYQNNTYYPPVQWSNSQAQSTTGQNSYPTPSSAEQRLMQRLDRSTVHQTTVMPHYSNPHQHSQPLSSGQNNAYALPIQHYQKMPNAPANTLNGVPTGVPSKNQLYYTPPLQSTAHQAYGQTPVPVNPLTQKPRVTPIAPPAASHFVSPKAASATSSTPTHSQQEVVVVQRPQPGTGEYKLTEVLGPAPGDPMIFHAREPDAERPKPGTGEYTVKELLGPAPGDPRAYKDLTQEADVAKSEKNIPVVETQLEATQGTHVLEPPTPDIKEQFSSEASDKPIDKETVLQNTPELVPTDAEDNEASEPKAKNLEVHIDEPSSPAADTLE